MLSNNVQNPAAKKVRSYESAAGSAKVTGADNTEKATLNDTQKLILSNQSTILDSLLLARVMAEVFDKALPEGLRQIPDWLDALTETEKYEQLVGIVRSLDVYFQRSPIHREEQGKVVERWDAKTQLELIENLDSSQNKKMTSVLKALQLTDELPLQLTRETTLLFPGAAIPRMNLRPQFAIDNNSDNILPERVMCLGSSRPLNGNIDVLQDATKNKELFDSIDILVKQFDKELGNKPTETHAQMALMDRLRTDNPNCFLVRQPVYLAFTGGLTYSQQSIQENGEYELGEKQAGRANTEATMVSAFSALQKLPGRPVREIVLVSNQPHVRTQQLAAERVASLSEYCSAPITVQGCGPKASLDTSIFLAIDSARKSIQLLNPAYNAPNWYKRPEFKLFVSTVAGEWKLYEPDEPGAIERLV